MRKAGVVKLLIIFIILTFSGWALVSCDLFEDEYYTLTMEEPEGSGTVVPGVGTSDHESGTMVDLEATPDEDYSFKEWEGEVQDRNAASTKIKMDKNQTVKAVFVFEDPAVPGAEYDISVLVMDEQEQGIEGIEVEFSGEAIEDFIMTTDAEGSINLSGAEAASAGSLSERTLDRLQKLAAEEEIKLLGEVTITPDDELWEFEPQDVTVTEVDAGSTVEFIGTSLLAPIYQIGGTVEDIHGKGVAEAEVLLSGDDIDEGAIGEIITDADGSWGPIQVEGTVNITAAKDHWTFTPITVQAADINLVITGEIFKDAVKMPVLTPGAIPLGQSTDVMFNVHVDINPAYLTEADEDHDTHTPVSIYRKDDSNSWEFMGNLFDDGDLNHGDEIKGDRIYSNIFNFYEEEVQNIELKISVNTEENHVIEVKFQLEAASVPEELEGKVLETHQEAEAELNAILVADPGLTAAESLAQLGGKLLEKEEIVSAVQKNNLLEIGYEFIELEPGDNFTAVSFIMIEEDEEDAGLLRGRGQERRSSPTISPSQQTTGKSVSYQYTPLNEELEFIGSRNIFIWSPFAEEFSPWDETEGVQERFNESELGFDYSVYKNFAADVESLKSINDYGMAVLATHGSGGRWLATGEVVFDDNKYSIDLAGGRMAVWQNMKMVEAGGVTSMEPVYAVNDNWFTHHVTGNFNNAVIVNNSCESLVTDSLWNAFASLGAGAYYGYDGIVTSRFAVEQVYELVEGLRDGVTTTGEAYQEKTDPYSAHNARWLMRGNEDLVFPAGLINGSFEDGLNAWLKDGDGRAISALDFLEPTDGNVMGIISSGLGFTVRHGSLQQTFRVEDDAEMLRFDYNYLSEEFLQWIGSVYQDPFQVTIESESGTEEILYLTVDGIAAEYGASYCASHAKPASECIMSSNSGSLIPVSPYIAFDRGDVWMTGWQSFAFDISAYQGEVVTLKFMAEDEGDTIFDTAVLLDNIRIEDSAETKDEYILTINKTGEGETHPAPGSYSYPAGTMAKINAFPNEDVEFYSWHGSPVADAEAEDTTVLMDGHKTVTAVFVSPVPSTSFIYPVADIDLPVSEAGTEQTLNFWYYVFLGTDNHYFTATLLNYDTLEETTYSNYITESGYYEGEITYTAPEVDDPADAVHVVQELEISGQMTPDSEPEVNADTSTEYFIVGFSYVPSTSYINPVADIDLPVSEAGKEQTLNFEYYVDLGTANHYFTATLLNADTLEETTYSNYITESGYYEGEITYTAPEVDDPADAVHVVQELGISGQMTPDSEPEVNADTSTEYFTVGFTAPLSTSFIEPVADIELPVSEAGKEQTLSFEYFVNLGTDNHYFTATLLNYDTQEETTYSELITETGFHEGEITYTAPELEDPSEAENIYQELELSGQMTPDSEPAVNADTSTVYFMIMFSDDFYEPEGNPEVFHIDIIDGWYSHTLPDFKSGDDGYVIHFNKEDEGMIHSFGALSTELEVDIHSAFETVSAAPGKAAGLTPELALQYSLRQQELELARRHKEISETPAKSMVYTAEPEIGDTRYFKVITSISHAGTPTVTEKLATLRAADSSGLLWVVEDDLNLSEADVQEYMNQYEDNIQPVVTDHFGREPEAQTFEVLEPGARTNILLTDMASGMGGYFWAIDLYSALTYSNSNEAKVIYISPSAYHTSEAVKGTIAHELQHMLFFNEKVLAERDFLIDDIWINEGFSCLASDLVGFGFEQGYSYAYSVNQFLNNTAMTSLLSWEGAHADYGAVYLFARYIFDREGQNILNTVSTSNNYPQNSIAAAAGVDFRRIFADWAVTLIVNDKAGVDSDYTFDTISIDSETISKNILTAGGGWTNKQIKGWGILYTQIPGEGSGGNLEITSDVGSPQGGEYSKTVARYRN